MRWDLIGLKGLCQTWVAATPRSGMGTKASVYKTKNGGRTLEAFTTLMRGPTKQTPTLEVEEKGLAIVE